MKFQLLAASLLPLAATATETFVSDPGDGVAILYEEQVPIVLGSPWQDDPPVRVVSEVPVSILRYSDFPEFFLEGGQALYPHEMYVVVKSDCGDNATLIPQVEYENFTRTSEWDNGNYTGFINISFPNADLENVTMDTSNDTAALPPSIFTSLWSYASFWCQGFQTELPTVTVETSPPRPSEVDSGMAGESTEPETRPPVTAGPTFSPSVIPNREAAIPANVQGSAAVSAKAVVSLVVTVLSGVVMLVNLGSGHRTSSRSMLMGTMLGVTVLFLTLFSTSHSGGVTHAQSPASKANNNPDVHRSLQECSMRVEILVDGCRRVDQVNDTDLLVIAPSVSIYGKLRESRYRQSCF